MINPFQSTRPVWGATANQTVPMPKLQFQSTRPVWGATQAHGIRSCAPGYFNPRAPCGARRRVVAVQLPVAGISIHAPHAGRDGKADADDVGGGISIHAPHAGRDFSPASFRSTGSDFNPRAPCGARPIASNALKTRSTFQSTRPMRGATKALRHVPLLPAISIHAPHAGRDKKLLVQL